MKLQKLLIIASALGLVASGAHAQAPIVGYVSKTIAAGSVATPNTDVFSLTLSDEADAADIGTVAGPISGFTSNTITDSVAAFTNLPTTSQPYFVKITSGAEAGRIFQITASSATILTIDNGGTDLTTTSLANGDNYQIFEGATLGSFFAGADVENGASSNADLVAFRVGGQWLTFYQDATGDWFQPGLEFLGDENDRVINPQTGAILYSRRGTTPLTLINSGLVPDTQAVVELPTGVTFLSGLFPVDSDLNSLDLENLPGSAWASNSALQDGSAATADVLSFNDGSGWKQYVYNTNVGSNGWLEVGLGFLGPQNPSIPAGTPILLERGAGSAGTYTRSLPY